MADIFVRKQCPENTIFVIIYCVTPNNLMSPKKTKEDKKKKRMIRNGV